jgi:hypothetical protein
MLKLLHAAITSAENGVRQSVDSLPAGLPEYAAVCDVIPPLPADKPAKPFSSLEPLDPARAASNAVWSWADASGAQCTLSAIIVLII